MVFATIAPRRLFTGFKGLGGEISTEQSINEELRLYIAGGYTLVFLDSAGMTTLDPDPFARVR